MDKLQCCNDLVSTTLSPPVNECLKVRKYWCFLLSSICTFLAGLLIVLIWRAFAFLFCRKYSDYGANDPKSKELKPTSNSVSSLATGRQSNAKQEFEGNFITEAKDWAGELISGQTTTGRILVIFFSMGQNKQF